MVAVSIRVMTLKGLSGTSMLFKLGKNLEIVSRNHMKLSVLLSPTQLLHFADPEMQQTKLLIFAVSVFPSLSLL